MVFILFYIGVLLNSSAAVARTSLLLLLLPVRVCRYCYFCMVTPSLVFIVVVVAAAATTIVSCQSINLIISNPRLLLARKKQFQKK